MTDIIEQLSEHRQNLAVLRFLEGQNAHSDLAYFFFKQVRDLNKAKIYTPDDFPFPYSFAYASIQFFGFCVGMQAICLKIPLSLSDQALLDGGMPHEGLKRMDGSTSLSFTPNLILQDGLNMLTALPYDKD